MDAPQYPRLWIQVLRPNGSQFVGESNAPQVFVAMITIWKKIIIYNYHMPMIFNYMWHMQLLDPVVAQDKLHITSYMW
jgi:hypothetical protein